MKHNRHYDELAREKTFYYNCPFVRNNQENG